MDQLDSKPGTDAEHPDEPQSSQQKERKLHPPDLRNIDSRDIVMSLTSHLRDAFVLCDSLTGLAYRLQHPDGRMSQEELSGHLVNTTSDLTKVVQEAFFLGRAHIGKV